MSNATPLLKLRDLRREFPAPGEPLVVLDGVNLDLEGGRSAAIMGPSGSGKSTLLQIIGTLDQPTSGTIEIGGQNPLAFTPAQRAAFRNRRLGFVFQEHYLLPQCDVLENVLIPTLVGGGDAAALEKRAVDLIERVGLSSRIDHRPAQLSGGERQRAAIARALIHSPALLLCDEPTGNLDAKSAERVGAILRELQAEGNTSIIVVTHSAGFAALFDGQYRMSEGRLTVPEGAAA